MIAYVEGDYKPRLEYLNDESDKTVWPGEITLGQGYVSP